MHAVDKVQVGPPGLTEHDRVSGGPAEPGMRRAVVLPDVRLDLHDPAHPPPGGVLADQPDPEQPARSLQRGSGEDLPRDDGAEVQRTAKRDRMSEGRSGPTIDTNGGMSGCRKTRAVPEPFTAALSSFRNWIWSSQIPTLGSR